MSKIHADHNYYVYLLTNKNKSVLYTGVTNNLKERLHFHKNPLPFSKSFTKRYNCHHLLYFEHFQNIDQAIKREKEVKGWSRLKKEKLIEGANPNWDFLDNNI